MPITVSAKSNSKPVPAGVQQAICYGVVDIGTQVSANSQFGPKRKIIILFELPFERIDIEGKGNLPRAISLFQTASLSPKAKLRSFLRGWRGRDFTKEELEGFDLKNLVGVNGQVNIVHNGDYANIENITPLAKGQEKRPLENPSLYFALDDQPDLTNIKFPDNLPEWIREKVQASQEVTNARTGGVRPSNPATQAGPDAPQENLDEDVPF